DPDGRWPSLSETREQHTATLYAEPQHFFTIAVTPEEKREANFQALVQIVTLVNTPAAIALGLIHAIDTGDPVEMAWSVLAIVAHAPTRQTQVFGQGIAVRASPRVLAPTARGVATETRVLQDLGLVKNTQLVKTAEGASIPDALTPSLSVEIKDSAYVSATR